MRLVACSILLATACASWLDLDPVEPLIDRDSDGVYDELDNCRDVANPDQTDTDNNGIGDACEEPCKKGHDLDLDGIDDGCDACDRGPNDEDEDGDGIADSCDLCPFDADPVGDQKHQPDLDKDGVGDACDFTTTDVARRYFDSFTRVIPVWTSPAPWTTGGSQRVSTPTSGDLELYAVRLLGSDAWAVDAEIVVPVEPPDSTGDTAGIYLQDPAFFNDMSCVMRAANGGWVVSVGPTTSPWNPGQTDIGTVVFAPGVPIRLTLVHVADAYECRADAGMVHETVSVPAQIGKPSFAVRLRGTRPTEVHHVDIVAP